jgi:hypothetical protein
VPSYDSDLSIPKGFGLSQTTITSLELEVDTRDNGKPLFEMPLDITIDSLLNTLIPPQDGIHTFTSQRTMIEDWVKNRGYLELVEAPFIPTISENEQPEQDNLEANFQASLNIRPLEQEEQDRQQAKKMAHKCKRSQTFKAHWDNMIKASIAVFCRLLEINIDSGKKIGPLIDANADYHKGSSSLTNYQNIFGVVFDQRYMSLLGREVQMSPITHPVRAYNPKVLLLMACNNGLLSRCNHPGLYLGSAIIWKQ